MEPGILWDTPVGAHRCTCPQCTSNQNTSSPVDNEEHILLGDNVQSAYGTTLPSAEPSRRRALTPVSRARPRSHLLRSLLTTRASPNLPPNGGTTPEAARTMSVVTYSTSELRQRHSATLSDLLDIVQTALGSKTTSCWLSLPPDPDAEVRSFLAGLGLPPRALDHATVPLTRAKTEFFSNCVCIVAHAPVLVNIHSDVPEVLPTQVTLVLCPKRRLIVSFIESTDWRTNVLAVLEANVGGARAEPVSHLVCIMLDAILELYFSALEVLGSTLDAVESQVLREGDDGLCVDGDRGVRERKPVGSRRVLRDIHRTKHDLSLLRRQIWPMRECLTRLAVAPDGLINADARLRVRESLDRAMQVLDVLECYRDVGHALLDLHLASQNNRMQEVMQTLAVVTTLFVPLTFLAGIEGMNFKNQPELTGQWSYVVFWIVVAAILAGQIVFFRRKGWM